MNKDTLCVYIYIYKAIKIYTSIKINCIYKCIKIHPMYKDTLYIYKSLL